MWFHNNTYSSFSPTTALGVGSSQVGVDVIFMYIEFIEISHAECILVDSEQRVRERATGNVSQSGHFSKVFRCS